MYHKIKRVHLIGIGGIGMSAIAEILCRLGYQVSGSDLGENETIAHLREKGIRVFKGHDETHVKDAELVVYSSAIRPQNPEWIAALKQGSLLIPRAEMLAELMRLKYGIAIAGAHGKTTTTSMAALTLVQCGLDPTIVVGGKMANFEGKNAQFGQGEFMVVEADESDGSFNRLSPAIAVVTNLDREHMDHYGTMEGLQAAFLSFVNKVPFYGLAILCQDDPYLAAIKSQVKKRIRTYGFSKESDYRIENYEGSPQGGVAKIVTRDKTFELRLQVPGKHNMLNATAALVVADELSVSREKALAALASFQGVQRRFQRRGVLNGVTFIDDYAHHPTEIKATLRAAREAFPTGKVRALFQPHRYSRTFDLLDEFAQSFVDCHSLIVSPIYSAGESNSFGISSEILTEKVNQAGEQKARCCSLPKEGFHSLVEESSPGDVILTLGAGDITHVHKEIF